LVSLYVQYSKVDGDLDVNGSARTRAYQSMINSKNLKFAFIITRW
jgi:hypothetical protein